MTRWRRPCLGTLLLNLTLVMLGAAEPKRVLIVHSFGSAAPPFTTASTAFETALTEEMAGHVDLDEVSLDVVRYASLDIEEALVELMRKRQARWQPDLVVPIGSPAGVFVAQYRDRLFPATTPVIYTGMDQRRLPPGALQQNATFVGASYDLPGAVGDILQLSPATTNIVIVIGATSVEQFWTDVLRREYEPFTNRVSFTWFNDLSFDQMLERSAKLPPHSFMLFILLVRDATGVTHNADDALRRIHEVANAPMNGLFHNQLGMGIVGGRLYADDAEGQESARIASRILRGEAASSFPPRIVPPSKPQYDWRELRRWNISEHRLPPGSEVLFHTPTFWEQYKWHLIGIHLLVIAQAALIIWLVRSRRRVTELARDLTISESQLLKGRADLNDQLRFERLSTDISSTLMNAPVEELGKQVVPALGQMAQMLGFDAVSLWLLTGKDTALRAHGWHKPDRPGLPANLAEKDFPWSVGELFAGRDVQIGALDDFPSEAQTDRATAARYGLKSLWAVPMVVRGARGQGSDADTSHLAPDTFLGALSMGSFREELSVSPQLVQRQRVLANVFGNALVRARAEIALRESEKRLTLAATAGDLGLWLWDLQTNALWATERAKKMFGFAPESELTYEMFYGRVHPEDRPAVDAGIAGAISGKANYETQYRICLPDGAEKWIASRGEVAFEDGGQPVSVTGVVSDITERHVNAMELSRNRQELAHVARVSTMGELAASVAHELNQPLGAILANADAAELFLQQNPPALDDLRAILADIRKDDERAGEVIRRMRALLRKHELERQPIEINSLVEDVLQLISGDASLRGVSLSADLGPVLPKVSGDRVHLQQVLLNLILNGMDAMAGEPRERLRIRVRTRLGAEGVVELAVIDAGHGIEADKLPRLFEPFYTTKPNGMGMGLSIARTIIAAHHGRIWAENNPTGGAVFRVVLPVAEKEQGAGSGVQGSGGKR